jgi:hypothetical protein
MQGAPHTAPHLDFIVRVVDPSNDEAYSTGLRYRRIPHLGHQHINAANTKDEPATAQYRSA